MLRAALVALGALGAPAGLAAAAADRALLPAASDGAHAWIVVERTAPGGAEHVVLHHALAMGGSFVREAFVLPRRPEAIAASDASVWIVMPPAERGARRDVVSSTAVRSPATGAFYSDPPGRLSIHPSLPGDGALLGLAVDDGALLAWRAGTSIERLGPSGWASLAAAVPAGASMLSTVVGRPAVLVGVGPIALLGADGTFLPAPWQVPSGARVWPIEGCRRPTVGIDAGDGGTRVELLREGAPIALATVEAPARPFAVLGLGGSIAVFATTGEGGLSIRRIDPITGQSAAAEVLEPQRADASGWVCMAALAFAALGVAAGLAVRRALGLKAARADGR
ncbi:MAG: hypothetical protein ACKOF7_04715 [Phycisphaerales bacterium]